MPVRMQNLVALTVFAVAATVATTAHAQKKYDPGASDTEIKIGNIMPYSGPASAYGTIGKAQAAYFNKINAEGGINGRKINFISYDDAFSPPKAVEQARKLVESDEVLLIFQPLGTQSNSAIQKYMNAKKVPQLFVATGATKWGDPQNFPWTMGWQPNYQSEGRIYAAYILKNYPNGKIAALWQNDDAGKDQMKGLRDGLGDKASMIIADKSYEVSDPTIDSQIVALKDSGADIMMTWAAPKGAAQAIRKVAELGWKPVYFLGNVSTSVAAVLKPAGLDNSKGIISTAYLKDPTDPLWKDDPGIKSLACLHGQIFPRRRQDQHQQYLRLRERADHGSGAEAVRRQPDARERDEAGRKPEGFHQRGAAARHQDQHGRQRLLPDRTDAVDEVQRRSLGGVRRHHHRRGGTLGPPLGRTRLMAPGGVGPAATRIRTSKSLYGTSRRQANTRSPLRSGGAGSCAAQ